MESAPESELTNATQVIESMHADVIEFTRHHCESVDSSVNRAVKLYYAIRDGIRYDPYRIDLTIAGMRASKTLSDRRGWCVAKAVLLAACCRSVGIPARLGFADVRNHLSTERLRQRMGTDIFYWHGYTDMFLDNKWVKATPAFSSKLCQKLQLLPLEFDGYNDSIYHPYDRQGNRHLEYINDRGIYADLPIAEIIQTFELKYKFSSQKSASIDGNFARDLAIEMRL
jgi:transglutaminase-like putative cysteine protease